MNTSALPGRIKDILNITVHPALPSADFKENTSSHVSLIRKLRLTIWLMFGSGGNV